MSGSNPFNDFGHGFGDGPGDDFRDGRGNGGGDGPGAGAGVGPGDGFNDHHHHRCFLAGTLIRTDRGDVEVENLSVGDIVIVADGRSAPVVWVGKQTISTRFADPDRVVPIRVRAGAFGENVPSRDLLVSPDHALFVEGVLVHAGALVNGASVVRETSTPATFVYYHVETEEHLLLLAENTPAETFVDNVDRLGFDNWAQHLELYPEGRTIEEMPYPRAKSFRQVPVHLRAKLAERAMEIGDGASSAA